MDPFEDYNGTTAPTVNGSHTQMAYYSLSYQVISTVVTVVIFSVGIFGNILVVTVIARSKSMQTTTNCYLLSLAVSDSLVLLAAVLPAIVEGVLPRHHWPWGGVACCILVFLQYLGISTSALSVTIFTVERYIAICYPVRAHTMCTVKRSKKIIAVMWIAAVLYCSPWFGLTTVRAHPKLDTMLCTHKLERKQYTFYYMTDLIFLYVIPLILSACMYGCIGRTLYNSRMIASSTRQSCRQTLHSEENTSDKTERARIQVVRMLVVIVAMFAITWLPYRSMVVYNSFAKDIFINDWFLFFCRTMFYINSAVNPILYNVMSSKFRRAFRKYLCCFKNSK